MEFKIFSNNYYVNFKRIFDIFFSISVLIILLPILFFLFIIHIILEKGNFIFWSKRVGINNHIFFMPKLRTMKTSTPDVATHLLGNDNNYITNIGKILRKTSLDEIPQLYSVLKGDMSIVGPIGGIPGAQVPAFCAVRRHWAINHIRVPIRLIGDHIIIHRRERFLEHVGIPRIPALAIAIVYEVGDAVFIPRGAVGLSIRSASTRPLDGASTHTSAVLGRTYREKFQTVCIPLPESMR